MLDRALEFLHLLISSLLLIDCYLAIAESGSTRSAGPASFLRFFYHSFCMSASNIAQIAPVSLHEPSRSLQMLPRELQERSKRLQEAYSAPSASMLRFGTHFGPVLSVQMVPRDLKNH